MATKVEGVLAPSTAQPHFASKKRRVSPSVNLRNDKPFSLEQELEPFAAWTSQPIWVPPKDSSTELAESMLKRCGAFQNRDACWSAIAEEHRSSFTQVREVEMVKASIRLPKAKLYVTVTERADFDKIEDPIPACVQTRLNEFLDGPGSQKGVKVYYLKPLCVEVDDELVFTTTESLSQAIADVQDRVFAEYRRLYWQRRPSQWVRSVSDACLALPKAIFEYAERRRQRLISDYEAKLEFTRRKTALRAANLHRKVRTDGCTFNQMLALTNPLEKTDVARQYSIEHELSPAQREALLRTAAGSLPWFAALAYAASFLPGIIITLTAPPVLVCDPAFVAEMPDNPGTLLKIGHFDEVRGVTHVEI